MRACYLIECVPGKEGHQPANTVDLRLDLIVLKVSCQRRVVILNGYGHHLEDDLQ